MICNCLNVHVALAHANKNVFLNYKPINFAINTSQKP